MDEDETRFLLVYVPEEGLDWEEMESLAIERCDAEADEFYETTKAQMAKDLANYLDLYFFKRRWFTAEFV